MTSGRTSARALMRSVAAAGLCAVLSGGARADEQTERIQALEKRLDKSQQLIEALTARLAEVERGRNPAPPATAAVAASEQAKEIASLKDDVAQLSDSLSRRSPDSGLPLHGFADVGAGWSSGADPRKLRGFNAGTLDLYLTPQFGHRVKSLIELAVEYGEDGGVAIDLERLQLGYTMSDALTVWLGRFHTPFGLWNTSYHHGANLQTSIFRPRFIEFEDKGGIIADHSVGLWASGKTNLGAGKLHYDAYLANGPSIRERTLDFNPFTDDTPNKLVGFNVGYSPRGALSGLTVGVHGFGTTVNTLDTAGSLLASTKVRMSGAYFGYDTDNWEAIGEYYRFGNADLGSGAAHRSNAWFMQLGKTYDRVTPFVRFERAALDAGDAYFASQESGRSYRRASIGMRYAIDPRASFKFEVSRTNETAATLIDGEGAPTPFAGGGYRRGSLQYSVAF